MNQQETTRIAKVLTEIQQKYPDAIQITSTEEIKPFNFTIYASNVHVYIPKRCLITVEIANWDNSIQTTLYKCQPRGEFDYYNRIAYHNINSVDAIDSFKVYSDDDIKKAQNAQTKRAKNAWVEVGKYGAVLAGIKKYRIKMYHQNKLKSIQDPEVDVKIRVDIWYDRGGKYENQEYAHDVEFSIDSVEFLHENINELPNSKECAKEIVEHIKDIKTY